MELTDDELFEKLLNGEEITEIVKTKRGDFKIKYLDHSGTLEVARRKSKLLKDMDLSTLDNLSAFLIEEIAVCEVCIVDSPSWWKGAQMCPDHAVLADLYRGYLRLNEKILGKIERSRFGEVDSSCGEPSESSSVGGVLFPRAAMGDR